MFFIVCVSVCVCVFVYTILACVRWFLYRICDVCICIMVFRVHVPTFTKFCFPSQELVTQEVKGH